MTPLLSTALPWIAGTSENKMSDNKLKRLLEALLSDAPAEPLPTPGSQPAASSAPPAASAPARHPDQPPASEESPVPGSQPAASSAPPPASAPALQRQAIYLRTASRVSRAASSILNLDELLPQVVHLIQEQFDLYYVGIFLVQPLPGEPGEWAVLHAGTGHAGRQMVERRHRLRVGGDSMIGWCIAHRQARISLDVGADAVRFDNPLLPLTRSELALPLISRDRAIGAMTVHSARPAGFAQDDVSVLQNMAGQLANAIENARLFEDRERQIAQLSILNEITQAVAFAQDLDLLLETVYQQVSRLFDTTNFYIATYQAASDEWVLALAFEHGQRQPVSSYRSTAGLTGYILQTRRPLLLRSAQQFEELHRAQGIDVLGERALSWLGVPLIAAGRVVGVMAIQDYQQEVQYGDEDARLFSTIGAQIARALENVTILSDMRANAALLSMRIDQLDCLNDIGRRIDEAPSIPGFLEWVSERIPLAMQHPDRCRVAVELEGRVYGASEAMQLPTRLVQRVVSRGEPVGRVCLAYLGERQFLDEEISFLGDVARRISGYVENRHLFEQTQEALDEAAMLYRVARSLGQAGEEQEMFEFVLSEMLGSLGLAQGAVLIFDEDGQHGTLEALTVDGKPAEPGLRIPVAGNPACDRLIATREAVAIADARHDPLLGPLPPFTAGPSPTPFPRRRESINPDPGHSDRAPASEESPAAPGYRSMLLVPIVIGGRIVGALGADSVKETREFTARDIALVRAVADQLGIAMENRRLVRETQAALAEVEATHRRYLRRAWQEHLRQQEMLNRSAFLLDRTTDSGDLWLPDPDPSSFPQPRHSERAPASEESPTLSVPITLRGQTIGVLGFELPPGDRPWAEEELAFVEAVTDQLAQTLETARLFADTQRRAERERLIGEMTTKIRASIDIRDVLETAATELGQALGASRAIVRLSVDDPPGSQPVASSAPPPASAPAPTTRHSERAPATEESPNPPRRPT
jgi:GAF domain-containing protein